MNISRKIVTMKFSKNKYKKNDPTYLSDYEYKNPKEYFKKLASLINGRFGQTPISIIDVGCASGSFLYYLMNQINIEKGIGIDISEQHLIQARAMVPEMNFLEESVLNLPNPELSTFDVCTFLGTMGIFENIKDILCNLINLVKKEGVLYIFDSVNNSPVDMVSRYRTVSDESFSKWNGASYVRSKKTYEILIKQIDEDLNVTFHDFEMPFPIKKTVNPMRAWTIPTHNQKNQLVVGTGLMLNCKIIEIYY